MNAKKESSEAFPEHIERCSRSDAAADCSRGDQKPPETHVHLYMCILSHSYAIGSLLLRNYGLLSQMQKLF